MGISERFDGSKRSQSFGRQWRKAISRQIPEVTEKQDTQSYTTYKTI